MADGIVIAERLFMMPRRFLPATAILALLGFALTLLWVRTIAPTGIDRRVTLLLQTVRGPFFYRLMLLVSSLGYAPAVHLLLVAAAALLIMARKPVEAFFSLASAGAAAIVVLIKVLVGRPRPSGENILVAAKLPDYGFPSGHTAHYVSFYGFLAYLAATQLKAALPRRLALSLALLLIGLVGPSRVYLGQHWLSDVVAAYLFGLAYLVGLTKAYERVMVTRPRRPRPFVAR